jgi:hypothetical protein
VSRARTKTGSGDVGGAVTEDVTRSADEDSLDRRGVDLAGPLGRESYVQRTAVARELAEEKE